MDEQQLEQTLTEIDINSILIGNCEQRLSIIADKVPAEIECEVKALCKMIELSRQYQDNISKKLSSIIYQDN